MKSYMEYCAVARALDVIGDRWSLLIVRELLLRPCRYTDLRDGLPGIATNLLADRLRQLTEASVVVGVEEPPPIATTVYRLTERGQALSATIYELVRWGAPLMAEPPGEQAFRSRWLRLAVEALLDGRAGPADVTIQLDVGDEPVIIQARQGRVRAHSGIAAGPDLVMTGPPHTVLGLVAGYIDVGDSDTRGAQLTGDVTALARLHGSAD